MRLTATIAARLVAALVVLVAFTLGGSPSHGQDDGYSGGSVGGSTDDDSATVDVDYEQPGAPGSNGSGDGPRCWYGPLMHTTQEEQRNEIRPEEQRPGVWGWLYCDDGSQEFMFFPDEEPVDPRVLANSVTITPAPPALRTNPSADTISLVNLETWFWAEGAGSTLSDSASAGPVTVTVSATPRTLRIDPGDGSPAFTCDDFGVAYDRSRPAASQSTTCGHTYRAAGDVTVTATLIYDVGFSSNVGVSGELGTISPTTSVALTVTESQAIVIP